MGQLLRGEEKVSVEWRGEPVFYPELGDLWDGASLWSLFLPKKETPWSN